MVKATVYDVKPLIGIEFDHGIEILPANNGKSRLFWAAINKNGVVSAFFSPGRPEYNDVTGEWMHPEQIADFEEPAVHLFDAEGTDDDGYAAARSSLRRIAAGDLVARI